MTKRTPDGKNNPTPLEQRMSLHVGGQITWPEPNLRTTCAKCRHFTDVKKLSTGVTKGRCHLVMARHKIIGVKFETSAIACPLFSKAS